MELKAVLVGCGAMSKAWLEAARRIPELTIVGLADLDRERAAQRAAEFGLAEATIARDVQTLLAETRPDLVFDVVVPQARHDVVSAGLAAGCHVLSEKPMAETLEAALRPDRPGEGRGAHPRRGAEPPLLRGRPADRPGRSRRRDRRTDQRPRRLLPRPAFRRVPRGDGPRPAARHGDPRLRRPPGDDRARRRQRLLPRMEPALLLVSPGLVGGCGVRAR